MSLRQKFVMQHHQLSRKIGLRLGHAGYGIGLFEYMVTDIVLLRAFAMMGAGSIVSWQLLQPKVQWVTAAWNMIYASVNMVQLAILQGDVYDMTRQQLRGYLTSWGLPVPPERLPAMTWEVAKLHRQLRHRLTVRQFSALVDVGEFFWLVDGALLAEERGGEACVYLVTDGACEVSIAVLGPGSAVGEVAFMGLQGGATVRALGTVRCFSVPLAKVRELSEAPGMKGALEGVFVDTLASRLAAMQEAVQLQNYRAVLEVACSMGRSANIATGVAEYRKRHGITFEEHAAVLDALPQCEEGAFTFPA